MSSRLSSRQKEAITRNSYIGVSGSARFLSQPQPVIYPFSISKNVHYHTPWMKTCYCSASFSHFPYAAAIASVLIVPRCDRSILVIRGYPLGLMLWANENSAGLEEHSKWNGSEGLDAGALHSGKSNATKTCRYWG